EDKAKSCPGGSELGAILHRSLQMTIYQRHAERTLSLPSRAAARPVSLARSRAYGWSTIDLSPRAETRCSLPRCATSALIDVPLLEKRSSSIAKSRWLRASCSAA